MKEWDKMRDEWFHDIDPKAYDLVLKMLADNPKDRILVDDSLAHEYFDEVRDVINKKRKFNCVSSKSDEKPVTSPSNKKLKTKDNGK